MTPATSTNITLGDVEVSRIGLGTNRLRNTPDNLAFVGEAVDAGIDHIDTAYLYADGDSETTIGAALAAGARAGVVATKGGYRPGQGRPDVLREQIEESLRRLRTDCIDLYYLHRIDPETPLEESLGAIAEQRDAGKIRAVGISNASIEQIERARQVVPIAAVQNHYSLAEPGHDDVVDYCAGEQIPFVAYFPLRGTAGPALAEVAERHGSTPQAIALAWLLDRSPAIVPIPGTLSIAHVRENLASLEIELTDAERRALAPQKTT